MWNLEPPQSRDVLEQLARMVFERVERWLDQGMGSCVLKDDRFAELVAQSLRHFHEDRYELGCSVVMANARYADPRNLSSPPLHGSYAGRGNQ